MTKIDLVKPTPTTKPADLSNFKRPLVLATIFTALAGFLDAAAYIQLNHLYVSFMSGNSTHLGISLSTGSISDVMAVLEIVAAFVLGASVGTWLSDRSKPGSILLTFSVETGLLMLAFLLAVTTHLEPALIIVAAAMGMQNSLHQLVAGADVGKGFITGALFSFGQSVARHQGYRALSNLFSWSVFVLGAALGAISLVHIGLGACLAFALITASVVLVMVAMKTL